MKIGLISDTHSYLDDSTLKALKEVDEIWHAGDIGTLDITDQLMKVAPVRAVFGNIDNHLIRSEWPEHVFHEVDGARFLMAHIAGRPGTYNPKVRDWIAKYQPSFLICGHSHILKVQFDKRFNLLYVNPGAVGLQGFHLMRTLITFEILNGKVTNMQAVELGKRGR